MPTFDHEIELWSQGYTVIGIDEVGRGALSGPLYVSGVAFSADLSKDQLAEIQELGINDSKKLSAQKRQQIAKILRQKSVISATAASSCDHINEHGIISALNNAILQVIEKLTQNLPQNKIFVLLDGTHTPDKFHLQNISYRNIIKGDSTSLSIASASIIAKVTRDAYMEKLSQKFPMYEWHHNKGYGTARHINAIKAYGASSHHRILYLRKITGTLKEDHGI